MNKLTDTLSRMAMAVPLTVTAPVAFSSDAVSLAFTGNGAKMLPIGTQWHRDQPWRLPDRVNVGGYRDLILAEWDGKRYCNTELPQSITDIGITPVFRSQDCRHTGWYVEGDLGAQLPSAAYNKGWRRPSTAYEFGDHIRAEYIMTPACCPSIFRTAESSDETTMQKTGGGHRPGYAYALD